MLAGVLNVLIRAHLAYFLWEVMTHQDDPRFAGKAIPIRNLVIVSGMSMLFPAVQMLTKRWRRYPWGWDALYLSLYWLDMAGNSFDLYDSHTHFDLIPHCHGESLTDVFFGTHNVRAWWDQPGDLLAGLVGTLAYPALARRLRMRPAARR